MFRTDFDDFSRKAKKSAWYYADLIQLNGFGSAYVQCAYDTEREAFTYGDFPPGSNQLHAPSPMLPEFSRSRLYLSYNWIFLL